MKRAHPELLWLLEPLDIVHAIVWAYAFLCGERLFLILKEVLNTPTQRLGTTDLRLLPDLCVCGLIFGKCKIDLQVVPFGRLIISWLSSYIYNYSKNVAQSNTYTDTSKIIRFCKSFSRFISWRGATLLISFFQVTFQWVLTQAHFTPKWKEK